jgi:diguanylate cyclase
VTASEPEAEVEALRAELERERWAARHDPLTGALNRRGLTEVLDAAAPPASIGLVDLDLFKRFNEESGLMASGDQALCLLASLVASGRSGDVVGRWGGDEFVVLFPATDPTGAAARLDRFLDEARRLLRIGDELVTFSAGTAAIEEPGRWRPALAAANRALVRAKAAGRARVLSAP